MSSFFLPARARGKDRKRSRQKEDRVRHVGAKKTASKRVKKDNSLNEEIESDSEQEDRAPAATLKLDEELSDIEETAPEKRLRLAKEYLARLQDDDVDGEADTIDHDAIADRLRDNVLEQAGRLQKKVADQYLPIDESSVRFLKGHRLPVTVVTITSDGHYAYSGSKDSSIIKWNILTGEKVVVLLGHKKGIVPAVEGHTGTVMALAVSTDGKYMASAGADKVIRIWDGETNLHLHTFKGHKDTVSGLVFQKGTHELFSCSFDRTIKIWNLDEMSYVETLFGHQDPVTDIDCLSRERPVTSGSDRSVRVWKIVDESQLVFHGHKASIDTVRLINEEHFISGSQDGKVALWGILKKKPLVSRPHHQVRDKEEEVWSQVMTSDREHWVTAVAALPNTDLVASGSNDGYIQFWKCGEKFRSLDLLFVIPVRGFVNSLVFSKHGNLLVAGIGQEHKMGRWWKDRGVKNGIALITLTKLNK